MLNPDPGSKRIAIIGSGISGLACAWFLRNHHQVTVFEKDNRLGGHANTLTVEENDRPVHLDTGFMVYNEVTYPLLTRLFRELDVETKPTSMSFSVQHIPNDVEFNGGSLNLLFAQRKNLFRPRFWGMLSQINRFNRETIQELDTPQYSNLSLQEYVTKRKYGRDFYEWYLSPMASAVWSSPPHEIDNFPARTLMRFWHNHGFLGLNTQHPWRTVVGGSKEYVSKMAGQQGIHTRPGKTVKKIRSENSKKIRIDFADQSHEIFDTVILASHADQSLAMLDHPTPLESDFLTPFKYQTNEALVHTDTSFMPRAKTCWASWNYRVGVSKDHASTYSTHYWMNNLQGVSNQKNYFVSINPPHSPEERNIIKRIQYEHPVFDLKAIEMQSRVEELHQAGQNTNRYFCGAWQRNGFHEDGIQSAFNLCKALLERDPWP
ncbi:FAD-dependent oxidoreductase [Luteolibacter pohnpeiensis]|uniref:FAD-dependent oxidoreductase n=1 Tax=Luteolibacter pohnpeiensis TaxID=454153 RepID=A0A934VW38_9BACT|nr:FAD-dependent oxidoreductase [Luteolibacter pohnpeiensis]MBK1882413.1 FAD-dependent oxidoreductase [Luteolibacter pohnpeiensis]